MEKRGVDGSPTPGGIAHTSVPAAQRCPGLDTTITSRDRSCLVVGLALGFVVTSLSYPEGVEVGGGVRVVGYT